MIDARPIAVGLLLLSACSRALTPEEQPAVIEAPSSATRAELARVVAEVLNGVPAALADDALTVDSVLVIERAPLRDAQGRRLNGRVLEPPERFRLVKTARECVLIHERSGTRRTLTSTNCRASRT